MAVSLFDQSLRSLSYHSSKLAALVFVSIAMGLHAQAIGVPSVYKASFGDDLHIDKYKTSYYAQYQNLDNYSGLEYTQHHYRWGDWTGAGEQYTYVSKRHDSEGTMRNLSIGHNDLNNSNVIWTADFGYAKKVAQQTSLEVSFNRDRVEVQQSLVMNVLANQYSASIEQALTQIARLQLSYGETRYTDGNHRPTIKVKAAYDVLPEQGVGLQLRSRYFRDTDTTVNSGYFNPYRFVENLVAMEVNRKVAGWSLIADVGYGRQAGGDDPKTLAKAFEFSATTPIARGIYFRAKAGYFRSLGYSGSDFIYRYVSEDVVMEL